MLIIRHFVALVSLFAFTQTTWANGSSIDGRSAHRDLGVSWQAYRTRAYSQSLQSQDPSQMQVGKNAVDSATAFGKAHLPQATPWTTLEFMQSSFRQFRDLRFLTDNDHANFLRRSTWLYPDDGCYARAALAVRNLIRMHIDAPKKIFVFGDLSVKSVNAPGGLVGWWYHVAPIVEVDGQKFVLDPAIDPSGPLKVEDWLSRMSSEPNELEVAVCNSGTYSPYDLCSHESDGVEQGAEYDQAGFLSDEWNRLIELGRHPEDELGATPPWN